MFTQRRGARGAKHSYIITHSPLRQIAVRGRHILVVEERSFGFQVVLVAARVALTGLRVLEQQAVAVGLVFGVVEREFVVQYDVLEALSGDPPEGDAADTFNRFSDTIVEAALAALARNPDANPVIVSENDLE